MNIKAKISNQNHHQKIIVSTNGDEQELHIAAKTSGKGSSVNGGELLFLALATCYCNDIYREAARQQMTIESVTVEVDGEFGGPGDPARHIQYNVQVLAPYPHDRIQHLIHEVDQLAEIHNTLRKGIEVTLVTGHDRLGTD